MKTIFGLVSNVNMGKITLCSVERLKEGFLNPITYETCQRIAEAANQIQREAEAGQLDAHVLPERSSQVEQGGYP